MRLRRASALLLPVALVASGVATAGCTGPPGPDTPNPSGVAYVARTCPIDVSAALVGAVTCGTLTVPENRDRGTGTVRLLVASLTPPQLTRDDPIVVVGTDLATWPNYAGIAPLAQRTGRRVLFLEQRGTAHSQPLLSCPDRPGAAAVDWTDRTGSEPWRLKIARAETRCSRMLRRRGIDMDSYDVPEMAADFADLIRTLDLAPVNLISYGSSSLITFALMRTHSADLRSVVMDTPAVPGVDPRARAASATKRALSRVLRWCARDPECRDRYADPQSLDQRAVSALARSPMSLVVSTQSGRRRVVLDPGLLVRVIQQAFTDGSSAGRWGLPHAIPALLASVTVRDRTTVRAALADLLGAQGSLCPGYRDKCMSAHVVDEGVWNTVACHDLVTPRGRHDGSRHSGAGFHQAYDRSWWWDVCRHWPMRTAGAATAGPVTSDVPTLVTVGGLAGPATLGAVRRATTGLASVSLVPVPTGSHNVLGWPCLAGLRDAWLDDPSIPPDVSVCAGEKLRWGR